MKWLTVLCFGFVTGLCCMVSHSLHSDGTSASCDVEVDCIGRIPYYEPLVLINPVLGCSQSSIISVWGDSRDNGKRKHEGIDIVARKGTPVIAPLDGVVVKAGWNVLGGKVIWLESRKTQHAFYFAHLSTIKVCVGDRVQQGDILGTVGNTGNARFTEPHLHFGIYNQTRKAAMRREVRWQNL
jgi:murein DD-endopeptidase MepM/ murein hydrolase activator NlpD